MKRSQMQKGKEDEANLGNLGNLEMISTLVLAQR